MSQETVKVIGFKLPQNNILKILDHLEGIGKTTAGEKVSQAEDCIIYVTKNSIWSITVDNSRKIIMQMKIGKKSGLQTINTGRIPISIDIMRKYLKRFSSSDDIEVFYENGMIALVKTTESESGKIRKVSAFFETKRLSSIRHDFIMKIKSKIKDKNLDEDKKLMEFFQKDNSVYDLDEEHKSVDFVGNILDNYVELSSNQLKKVVDDGDLLENRIYPFSVKDDVFNVTTKSMKDETQNRMERDISVNKSQFTGNFEQTYSSILSSAVASTSGNIEMYFAKNKQLMIRKMTDVEKEIELVYFIMPYNKQKN